MLFNVAVITQSSESGEHYRSAFLANGDDWFSAQQAVMSKAFPDDKSEVFGKIVGVSVSKHSGNLTTAGDYAYLGIERINKKSRAAA